VNLHLIKIIQGWFKPKPQRSQTARPSVCLYSDSSVVQVQYFLPEMPPDQLNVVGVVYRRVLIDHGPTYVIATYRLYPSSDWSNSVEPQSSDVVTLDAYPSKTFSQLVGELGLPLTQFTHGKTVIHTDGSPLDKPPVKSRFHRLQIETENK
jgi:hypothetical protein